MSFVYKTTSKKLTPHVQKKYRGQHSTSFSPGPGAYGAKSTFGGPMISFKGNYQSLNTSRTPGPGSYKLKSKYSNVGGKINRLPTSRKARAKTPGPKYTIPSTFSKNGIKFKSKYSPLRFSNQFTPGPGTYASRSSIGNGKRYSFGVKPSSKRRKSRTPGPGKYSFSSTFGNATSFSFKGKYKSKIYETSPGPGAYSTKSTFGQSGAGKYSLKGRKTSRRRSTTPGPGRYNYKSSLNPHGVTMLTSRTSIKRPITPGPKYSPESSYYKTSAVPATPRYSIGGKRRMQKLNVSPGPASYRLGSTLSKNAKSFSGRNRVINTSRTPGPGKYDVRPIFGSEGQKIKMKGKYKSFKPKETPGPKYSIKELDTKVGIAFKGKRTLRKRGNPTGPGQYDPKIFVTNTAAVFGTSN